MTLKTVPDPHLRYVDQKGKVLYIKHDYDTTPSMGESVTIEGERHVIRKESHRYNDDGHKEFIELTVEAAS